MRLIEKLIRSKVGINLETCEDAFVITPDFCCVVDGATSATGSRWTHARITGGQWASRILAKGVETLTPTCSPRNAIDHLTECIHDAYQSNDGVLEIMDHAPEERATASIILYSKHLNQLVCVGDCQAALIDWRGNIFQVCRPEKFNDVVMANARCMFLQIQLARGETQESLLQGTSDPGREYIDVLRKGQRLFQNNPKAPFPYQYWVLDGYPVLDHGIQVYKVPSRTKQIILASDGYPKLYPTLKKTEIELECMIKKDPHLIDKFRSTKGVRPGAESFDDRTYIRIDLEKNCVPPLTAAFFSLSALILFIRQGKLLAGLLSAGPANRDER